MSKPQDSTAKMSHSESVESFTSGGSTQHEHVEGVGSINSNSSASAISPMSPVPIMPASLPPPPTADQVRLVKESWNEIRDLLTVGDHVYKHLYQRSPAAAQLFRRFNPQSQSRAFMIMLGFAVKGLQNPTTLIPNLLKLGRRHQVYCVTQSDYQAMQMAVLEVLSDCFRERWTPTLEGAWAKVFSYLSEIMLSSDPANGDYADKTFSTQMQMLRTSFDATAGPLLAEFDGWLEKVSSGKVKRLNRRWVEIRGSQLFYSHEKSSPPSRVIELNSNCHLEEYTAKPYGFTLIVGTDELTFIASGDIDKDTWWEKIQKKIKESTGTKEEVVVFQGEAIPQLGFDDFDILKVLGRGSYGKVYKVRQKDTGEVFAMKVLRRDSLVHLSKYRDMELAAERKILQKIDHPFIVKLHHAFFTDKKLCFVLDFLQGGVLLWHMNNRRHQPSKGLHDSQVQFYTSEVVTALQHLHSFGIIYRDLKPENLLMDKDGHVVLTDFGLATTKGQGIMMCGSAPFMAPEIVRRQPYTQAVDWWSLGVLIFEMMSGTRLFPGSGDNSVFTKILSQPIRFPSYFAEECKDLLRRMLVRDPAKRITGEDVMAHPWLSGINFDLLVKKKIQPPFVPDRTGSDTKYFNPCSQVDSVAVNEPAPAAPPPTANVEAIQNLLEEFPHNSRVKVLSQEEYGQPMIAPDGTIRTDGIINPTTQGSSPTRALSDDDQRLSQLSSGFEGDKPLPNQVSTADASDSRSSIVYSRSEIKRQCAAVTRTPLGNSAVMAAIAGLGRFRGVRATSSSTN